MRYSGWFKKHKSELRQPRQAHPGRDIALGERSFGKAYVNCCLRGNHSKWGKFRDKDAAVLQLLITPRQDDGYKLRELVLELCFSECDPLQETKSCDSKEPSLIILEPPSPRYLRGQALAQHISREISALPQVGAVGISLGGMGLTVNRSQDVARAWRFQGHRSSNDVGTYTNAQWTWTAVAENPDIEDVGALYAGLIIQHPDQPFYITCKVQGKLMHLGRRYLFGNDYEQPCYTCVYPQSSPQNIEEEAERLESSIVELITQAAASE
jgi:hypothetical protein